MKIVKRLVLLVPIALVVGCSPTDPLAQFNKNLLAAICANPQGAIANLPSLVSPAQAEQAIGALCAGAFGTVQAPASAPGMSPAIPSTTTK